MLESILSYECALIETQGPILMRDSLESFENKKNQRYRRTQSDITVQMGNDVLTSFS